MTFHRMSKDRMMSFPKTVFMFSGQGSQYRTMGRPLFETDPVFRDELRRLDRMASDLTGERVLEQMHAGSKADSFARTLITHPAIFMLEWALAQSLLAKGVTPIVSTSCTNPFVAPEKARICEKVTEATMMKRIITVTFAVSRSDVMSAARPSER